jgi:hypothetical protein
MMEPASISSVVSNFCEMKEDVAVTDHFGDALLGVL